MGEFGIGYTICLPPTNKKELCDLKVRWGGIRCRIYR